MTKRTSAFARILAALALVAAVVAIVVAVSSGLKNESSNGGGGQTAKQEKVKPRTKAKAYVVKPGDTLIAISRKTGVPVFEIKALNPEVDPQILIAGETLKLK